MKISAGILLFRKSDYGLEYLLVHPGGPFYVRKDEGFWSIPKGEPEPGEELMATAVREFEEETGFRPSGNFMELPPIRQTGGKAVYCWGVEGDFDPDTLTCNTFEMEWPPKSGQRKAFPENDRAAWFNLTEACNHILEKQRPLLSALDALLRPKK
ncbi:NUDIX domain-containing protein [Pedobacter sp. BAL39]|uniref:NUDIX hydrolase n=1 Tax=Pedobacter sp. BAL39 TaxID=391596 RepID=UPI00058765CC|nr:NUDIX domain-containing protein [Pedobacter sp. BAL39]